MSFRDLRSRDADALRYCPECAAWTGHDQTDDGAYCCRLDHGDAEGAR